MEESIASAIGFQQRLSEALLNLLPEHVLSHLLNVPPPASRARQLNIDTDSLRFDVTKVVVLTLTLTSCRDALWAGALLLALYARDSGGARGVRPRESATRRAGRRRRPRAAAHLLLVRPGEQSPYL